jgi:hypothetical protein
MLDQPFLVMGKDPHLLSLLELLASSIKHEVQQFYKLHNTRLEREKRTTNNSCKSISSQNIHTHSYKTNG